MRIRSAPFIASLAGCCLSASAQTVAPAYAANYSTVTLGSVPDLPPSYGGICFRPGNNNLLLIGGEANGAGGSIYQIGLVRDPQGNITGFTGTATLVSTAPNIDGGLSFGPLTVLLYTGYPINTLGQIKPGSTQPDRVLDLTPLGINASVGACLYVPAGNPGAGKLKLVSYTTGDWYSMNLIPDGQGTFNVADITHPAVITGGPEGVVYIPPTSPQFATRSILVTEYSTGVVSAYDVDANGDPIVATKRDFITDLSGAEGAVLDPMTGQFMFSTFGGGNHVVVVRGFAPPPPCYPNCDNSSTIPVLNAADFSCFINRFSSAETYANCDASTTAPVLNVGDFVCFLNRFTAGCN